MESIFSRCGLPGCCASMDGVHVELGCTPSRDRHMYVGKEGYPTMAFNVCVGHQLKIFSCTMGFHGSRNDKQMVHFDSFVKMVREDPLYTNYTFDVHRPNGTIVEMEGAWILCDGGYHKWRETICGYKHVNDPKKSSFSGRCESVRKDVERAFGIIKKRHMLVDGAVRLKTLEDVELAFKACCIFHNILLEHDGLDTIGTMETDWKTVDKALGVAPPTIAHGLQIGSMAFDDTEHEVDLDYDLFREALVDHLEYKFEQREVEWLEPATICRSSSSRFRGRAR